MLLVSRRGDIVIIEGQPEGARFLPNPCLDFIAWCKSAIAALVALGAIMGTGPVFAQGTAPEGRTASVVVLPFANITGESGDEWIGAGIAEALVTDLEGQVFAVIGPERVVDVLGTLPGDELATEPHQALEVGRRVGADWLISGAYQRLGDRIRITGRFVEVVTGTVVRSAKVDGALDQLFALQDRVLAELLSGSVSEASGRGGAVAGPSPGPSSVQVPATAPARAAPGAARSVTSSPDVGANTSVAPGTVAEAGFTEATLTAAGFPLARARRVESAPNMDGEVLDDPAWADAVPVTGFWQTAPDEGEPASERTEVWVIYTEDTIYFGVVCYDRTPESIVVTNSRRDSSLRDSDSFQLILDTFLDQQNAFVFGTSPAGQEYDGQVVNEGVGGSGLGGGGASLGAGGGFNLNWDGVWEVRTQISEVGWSAEFAIPFRTIRYPGRQSQKWGVNFQRDIRRRNETTYWAPLPRQFNLFRLSLAGQLSGIEVPNAASRNLKLTPYVVGEAVHSDVVETPDTTMLGGGMDLKYGLTPSLTLDMTYNTDFAQVEVDQQQINLDRFNLFFPEKRPFFLENAGAFTVSNAGGAVIGNPAHTELFFSRRIGLGPDGREVPIVGGARMSGKVSDSVTVGLLNMQTKTVEGVTPANNFSVARVRRDFGNRSNIGGLFVNRQATGDLTGVDDYNRTYAVDGRWGIGQSGLISGFAARTQTPGLDGADYAYNLAADYTTEAWRYVIGYMEIADNFNPEVGFLRRSGFRKVDAGVFNTYRPKNFLKLQELRPHLTFNRFWNFDGFVETSLLHIHSLIEFNDSSSGSIMWNVTGEGVTSPFEISPGVIVPTGTYDHNHVELAYTTNRAASVSVGMRATIAGFFGGDRTTYGPSIRVRSGDTFNASLSWGRNDVDLPGGSFTTNLSSARLAYNFSPRLFTQTLLQYNDSADLWSVNLRFGWLQQANTGLFIVYNDTRGLGDEILSGGGRSLIFKYSQLFDLLD